MAHNNLSDQQSVLAEVFKFSPEDVVDNRRGRISPSQKKSIRDKHYSNCSLARFGFVFVSGIGLFGVAGSMIRNDKWDTNFLLTYLGIAFFVGLLLWALFYYFRLQMQRTLKEENVCTVKGRIRFVSERPGNKTVWFFAVDERMFEINTSEHFALNKSGVEGRMATMYFSFPWKGPLSVILEV